MLDASKRIFQIGKDDVRVLGSRLQSATVLGVTGDLIEKNSEFHSGEVILGREISTLYILLCDSKLSPTAQCTRNI